MSGDASFMNTGYCNMCVLRKTYKHYSKKERKERGKEGSKDGIKEGEDFQIVIWQHS